MKYVELNNTIYPITTPDDLSALRAVMADLGVADLPVYQVMPGHICVLTNETIEAS